MKKLIIILMTVMTISLVTGCASFNFNSPVGRHAFNTETASIVTRGEATNRVWFSIFGEEFFPTVERIARENNIKKIATVEYSIKPGILMLWMDYTTIVTGE